MIRMRFGRFCFFLCVALCLSGFYYPTDSIPTDTLRKDNETIYKIKKIERALQTYARSNFRLPCPALSGLEEADANGGKEYWPNTTPSKCGSDPNYYVTTVGNVSQIAGGAIPYRTLGLEADIAIDAWGRKFRYFVDQNFANKGRFADGLEAPDSAYSNFKISMIFAKSSKNVYLVGYPPYQKPIAAVISYGENGYGAVTKDGVQLGASPEPQEQTNHAPEAGLPMTEHLILYGQDGVVDDIGALINRVNIISATDDVFCAGSGTTPETLGYTSLGPGYPEYYWRYHVPGGGSITKPCYTGFVHKNDSTLPGHIRRSCVSTPLGAVWGALETFCSCPEETASSGPGFNNLTWPKSSAQGSLYAVTCVGASYCSFLPVPGCYPAPIACSYAPVPPALTNPSLSCVSSSGNPQFDGKYDNTVSRQCSNDEQIWAPPVSSCTCTEQTITDGGVSFSGTWPAGQAIGTTVTLTEAANNVCISAGAGEVDATCSPIGGWLITRNTCDPAICPATTDATTHTVWPDAPVRTPLVVGSCDNPTDLTPIYQEGSYLYQGSVSRSCEADGTWGAAINFTCGCPEKTLEGDGYRYKLPIGTIGTVITPTTNCNLDPPINSSWSGNIEFTCTDTGWNMTGAACVAVCPASPYNKNVAVADFPATAASASANGICPAGLEVKASPGVVTRNCRANGTWEVPYGACVCPAAFSGTGYDYPKLGPVYVGNKRYVKCNTGGLVGSVEISCTNAGWVQTGGSCN